MLVDLTLIGIILLLKRVSGILFGFVAAWALFRISSRTATGRVKGGLRVLIRIAAVIVLLVATATTVESCLSLGEQVRNTVLKSQQPHQEGGVGGEDDSVGAVDEEALGAETIAALVREVEELRQQTEEAETRTDERPGVLSFLLTLWDDLGFGLGWAGLYFTIFLARWKGQTPGKRLLKLRVVRLTGEPLGWWPAFERFGGYAASLATGMLGFIQIIWDANRQGIHDKVVGTVVIQDSKAAQKAVVQARRRTARSLSE